MKPIKLYYTVVLIVLAVFSNRSFAYLEKNFNNSSPKIIITSPLNNGLFSWNATIRYSIKIIDNEDGSSEYDEINAKEVLLEVCYLKDVSKVKNYLARKANVVKENKGLTILRNSDCFTCHASKNKLIGPSFELIAKRYPVNRNSLERLTNKVMNGSAGIWGKVAMPAHPAMKSDEIREMISWILTNNSNPNISYYPGIEGAFRTKEKTAKETGKEILVITASYTDHGEKGSAQNKKYGQYTVLLNAAN